jgi:hypothetical protein
MPEAKSPLPGDLMVLSEVPPDFLDGLPQEDQQAVAAALGTPMLLTEYPDADTAELRFTDAAGVIHFIYVNRASYEASSAKPGAIIRSGA